jgi:hypothetical protein
MKKKEEKSAQGQLARKLKQFHRNDPQQKVKRFSYFFRKESYVASLHYLTSQRVWEVLNDPDCPPGGNAREEWD